MSELKAGVIKTPHDEGMSFNRDSDHVAVTEGETEFYLKSEADKVIRRQKYKRCMAMAKWCKYWANYWKCCEPPDCSLFIAKAKYYRKWQKRWLKIAEQFKENG